MCRRVTQSVRYLCKAGMCTDDLSMRQQIDLATRLADPRNAPIKTTGGHQRACHGSIVHRKGSGFGQKRCLDFARHDGGVARHDGEAGGLGGHWGRMHGGATSGVGLVDRAARHHGGPRGAPLPPVEAIGSRWRRDGEPAGRWVTTRANGTPGRPVGSLAHDAGPAQALDGGRVGVRCRSRCGTGRARTRATRRYGIPRCALILASLTDGPALWMIGNSSKAWTEAWKSRSIHSIASTMSAWSRASGSRVPPWVTPSRTDS